MANIIVVHGAPGAGKSTQAQYLSENPIEELDIHHISAGNRIRAIRTGTFHSQYESQVNSPNAPAPLPHELVNDIMFEYVSSCPPDSLVLIDGYPRFADAVNPFIQSSHENGHRVLGCINLDVTQDTCVSRVGIRGIRRGERVSGDTAEVAVARYGEYVTYTLDAIRAMGEIVPAVTIDANEDVETVRNRFNDAVLSLAVI